MAPQAIPLPLAVLVRFAHAAAQATAAAHGLDLLHVKGSALDSRLATGRGSGTDADVWVRPSQSEQFLHALRDEGWLVFTTFRSGSPFGHAATYRHTHFGYLDVHRLFPGITVDPELAFDAMWSRRDTIDIAEWECAVPDFIDQSLLLLLHAARGEGNLRADDDVARAWTTATPEEQQLIRQRADELAAQVALAAAIGELDRHTGDRNYPLWRTYSRGGTKLDQWRARVQAAPNRREAARMILRAPLVNLDHLAISLGHRPSRAEVLAAYRARGARLVRDLGTKRRRPKDSP